MAKKYTPDELNGLSRQELILLAISMQDQLEQLNANMERLIDRSALQTSSVLGDIRNVLM